MKTICKRLMAAVLTATLLLSCFVVASADDAAAAKTVVDAITNLGKEVVSFHNCDSLTDVVNINSGNNTMALAEGQGVDGGNAVKFQKKSADVKEHTPAFRFGTGVDTTNASTIEFDIYLSSGITFADGGWANFCVQSGYANESDTGRYIKIAIADTIKTWTVDAWNHVTIDISKEAAKANTAKQIAIRFYKIFAGTASDYFIIDNLVVSSEKTIAYADKAAIEEVAASYNALTDTQKALVTNYETLQGYQAIIAEMEQNAADVTEMINALPAADQVNENDQEAIEAARAAYDNLTDDEKALVTNLAKLEEAEQALLAFLETEKAKAQEVVEEINGLPATGDLTLDDQAAIDAIFAKYEALNDLVKPYVTNHDVLVAAEEKIDQIKAEETQKAQNLVNAIDNISIEKFQFCNCDALKDNINDVAVNLNSSGMDVSLETANFTQGTGAFKVQKKSNRTDYPEHIMGVRAPVIDVQSYTHITFDLYLTEGYTVAPTFANVVLHNANSNAVEQNILAKIDMKDAVANAKLGTWNHVSLSLPTMEGDALVKQVTLRIGSNFLAGDNNQYILVDNICFAKAKEFGYADKAAVEALEATYNQLTDFGKSKVTNLDLLNQYRESIAQTDEAIAQFQNTVNSLASSDVTGTDITMDDIDTVKSARELYNSLDDSAKTYCQDAYNTLVALEAKAEALLEAEADKVADMISKLPALDDLTLADQAALLEVTNAYNALHEDAQGLVKNGGNLKAAQAKMAELVAVQEVIDMIDALPEEIVSDTDVAAVNAAKDAYDALTADQKALVTNYQTLADALAQVEKMGVTFGDVNNDDSIDAKDALIVLKIAVDKHQPTDAEKVASDVNKDQDINAKDALEILKKAVGKPACF